MVDVVADAPGSAAPANPTTDAGPVGKSFRTYALALLVAIYTVNFLDRQIVTTLIEPIKTDLRLTDTQVGAMGGLYFAILYTVLGVPIARWADRGDRPLILTLSLAVWSGFTVLAGFAQNFLVLAISRMGVGVGEAGCSPTAHSLLAEYFPKESRATALAIYSMGISIGTLLGMALGGLIAERYGWRPAFFVAGAPGFLFGLLALVSLKEPRRKLSAAAKATATAAHMPLGRVLAVLRSKPTFWLFALGGAFSSFVSYAHSFYLSSYFLRNHTSALTELAAEVGMAPPPGALPLGFLSLALGLGAGIGGAFGSWLGGVAADKLGARDIRNYALLPLVVPLISVPALWVVLSTDNMALALILMLIPNIGVGVWWGPVYGGVQGLAPPAMRAMSAAILLFVINIIGLGGGPTLFGMTSDFLADRQLVDAGLSVDACRTAAGPAAAACAAAAASAVKTTMYLSTSVIALAMLCFALSRRTIARDMES